MTAYDCPCRQHQGPAVIVLPSERYFGIDPAPETAGTAQAFCQRWMAERERQRKAQERRWATKGAA